MSEKRDELKDYIEKQYITKELHLDAVISFILNCDKDDFVIESAEELEIVLTLIEEQLIEYITSLSFEIGKSVLKQKNIKQVLVSIVENNKNAEKYFYEFTGKSYMELLKSFNSFKSYISNQIPKEKMPNDFDIFKHLRNCICHNDENSPNFARRNIVNNETLFVFKIGEDRYFFKFETDKLYDVLSLYSVISVLSDKSKIVYSSDGSLYGYVNNVQEIENVDRFQRASLFAMNNAFKESGEIFLPQFIEALFQPKNNSSQLLNYLMVMRKNLWDLCDDNNFDAFHKKCNSELMANDFFPIGADELKFLFSISAYCHYLTSSNMDVAINNLQKSTNLSTKDATYVVSKIRNSIVHGTFFRNRLNNNYVFYDQSLKNIEYSSIRENLKDLYAPYIQQKEAKPKVSNLEVCANLSKKKFAGLMMCCLGFELLKKEQTEMAKEAKKACKEMLGIREKQRKNVKNKSNIMKFEK